MTLKKKYPGHLLTANPNNPRDELTKSVVLVVSHVENLAIGLQIDNPLEDIDLQTVARNIGIEYNKPDLLYYGGPHNNNKIHVVHSNDWQGLSTVQLNDTLSVTNDISVLAAIAADEGPEYYRACAGFWRWENGLLDQQLDPRFRDDPHKWEICPPTLENVFSSEGPDQWRICLDDSARYQVSAWF
jgi:putative AlgH/UPF0301 family transcriptional regulator